MAKDTKANPVKTSAEDMLALIAEEAPEKQTRKPGERADFVPDAAILAKVTSMLATTGAIVSAKTYGSEKEARKESRIWGVYAAHAVESIEGKTVSGVKILNRGTAESPAFVWKYQIATKRERKEKDATEATATPEAK